MLLLTSTTREQQRARGRPDLVGILSWCHVVACISPGGYRLDSTYLHMHVIACISPGWTLPACTCMWSADSQPGGCCLDSVTRIKVARRAVPPRKKQADQVHTHTQTPTVVPPGYWHMISDTRCLHACGLTSGEVKQTHHAVTHETCCRSLSLRVSRKRQILSR